MAKPLPWSFSALNSFVGCPHRHYEVKVLKNFPDEPGEAAKWGTYVHLCIENFIKDGTPLPDNAKIYAPQAGLAISPSINSNMKVLAEQPMALNHKFEPCSWKDGWVRGIIDLLMLGDTYAWAVDWKLGKVKPDSNQLKLFALMVFHHYPKIQEVYTSFEWLQFNQRTEETYYRAQIPELWNVFLSDLKQYAQAFRTDTWQKRPSGLCKNFCPVTTCEHCGGTKWKR